MKEIRLFLLMLIASLQAIGQNTTGKVTDQSGAPLIGATIVEKGTTNGTTADATGKFEIKVNSSVALFQISYIGCKPKELKGSELASTIILEEGNLLDQVVIVGSRSMNRSATDTPAPIDVIDIKEITSKTGQLDLNQLLQFAAPSFNSNRQSGSDGTDHVDPASLRGLGPDQTLVLINGKRRHQS